MGEAAYLEAEKNGELITQRLREEARKGADIGGHPEYELLVSEAADLIDWLQKERDSLINEVSEHINAWHGLYQDILTDSPLTDDETKYILWLIDQFSPVNLEGQYD